MTKARILTLADEIADDLGKAQFEVEFINAGRKYVPTERLENTDTPIVTVACVGVRVEPYTRSQWQYDFDLDIGIQHRVEPKQDTHQYFDAAMRLTEQIADKYRFERPTVADMALIGVEFGGPSGLPYLPAHITEHNQFTGVVRLTFRDIRGA